MKLSQLLTTLAKGNKTEESLNTLAQLQKGLPSPAFQERIAAIVLSFQTSQEKANEQTLDKNILNGKIAQLIQELTTAYTSIELENFNDLSKELNLADNLKEKNDFKAAANHYSLALEIAKKHHHPVKTYCEEQEKYCNQEIDNPYHSVIEKIEETETSMASTFFENPAKTTQNSFGTIEYNPIPVKQTDKKVVNEILKFAKEEDQLILDKAIINYDNLLPMDVLRSNYKAITVNRQVKKRFLRRKGSASRVLDFKNKEEQPSASVLKNIKKQNSTRTDIVRSDYFTIENRYPFNFDKIDSHDWFLLTDGIGVENCYECYGKRYVRCPKCNGKHKWSCSRCRGSGDVDCSSCGGSGDVSSWETDDDDGGSSYTTEDCRSCRGSGEDTCGSCRGRGEHVCSKCYGDNRDNRYGKIDCPTCDAIGELIYFHYIETTVDTFEESYILTHSDGKGVDLNQILQDKLKERYQDVKPNKSTHTYLRTAAHIKEYYLDEYEKFISQYYINQNKYAKQENYPLLIEEEIAYKQLPFYKMEYAFMADNDEPHQLLLRKFDDQTELIFDTTLKDKKYNSASGFWTWIYSDWGVEKQLKLNDEFRSVIFMAYLAKTDGFVDYKEKQYIAKYLSPIYKELTKKEQRYINDLIGYEQPASIKHKYAKLSSIDALAAAHNKMKDFLAANNMAIEGDVKSRFDFLMELIERKTPNHHLSILKTLVWISLTLSLIGIAYLLVIKGII